MVLDVPANCECITMHTLLLGVLLFQCALTSLTFAAVTANGPTSYLGSGAPVVILQNASLSVDVRCHGLDVNAGSRTSGSTLKPADHWSINFSPSSEDPLYCTFRSALRKWNCDERWLIKDACLWEKQRSLMSGYNNNLQGDSSCPRCELRNSIGKPVCVFAVQDDGIYEQQWDFETKENVAKLKHPWREDDPAFYDPTTPFRFSVTNFINHTVKIQCDVVKEAVFLEGVKPGGENPRWEYEIDPIVDVDYTYFTWTCEFEVLGSELRRGGVQIWSPQPEVNTWIRTPDCIDCAWKLDTTGLWLDDRSCHTDRPVWIMEHGWDSVLDTSTDDVDWSPRYYPLKSSPVHQH